MRTDWNERAREDANYYVAFGRRDQDDEEFFSTAADVVRDLEGEMKCLPAQVPMAARRALEIGCGPGRLMRPMSRYFGEIHGVDVSDEMITQAKVRLRDIPWAKPHHANGVDLSEFPPDYFDFVYSYAVFQHIPSAEVVLSYLRETVRVLKPGGLARLQINGLPRTERAYTTWEGVRIPADEIHRFTREHGVRLLSLSGVDTQYMWTSWQKPASAEPAPDISLCRIRRAVSAFSGELAVPSAGWLACVMLQIENLPPACDLNSLEPLVDGIPGVGCYIGPAVNGMPPHYNFFLPRGVRTGLVPIRVLWNGQPLCADSIVRVIPAGPAVPRLVSVTDGVNLLSTQRVQSRSIKITIEEADSIADFHATIDGAPVRQVEHSRTDPLASRYEINLSLPDTCGSGGHVLRTFLGQRLLAETGIEVI